MHGIQDGRLNEKKLRLLMIAGFYPKGSSHFCYYAFSTSLRMYHASELFIIKDALDIYTQQKQNNEGMLSTSCLLSKAADVS